MNAIILSKASYRYLLEAARNAAPLEACGLIGGQGFRLFRCFVLPNADRSPEHFRMQPEDQFAALRQMRAEGLELRAIWHSHPATPPRMSDEDLRLAFTPGVWYLILSLADPQRPFVKAFEVQEGRAVEVPLQIEEEGEHAHIS